MSVSDCLIFFCDEQKVPPKPYKIQSNEKVTVGVVQKVTEK